MLNKINALEEKLDSLIHRLTEMRREIKKKTTESNNLKKEISHIRKGKTTSTDTGDCEEIREKIKKTLAENENLRKKVSNLEQELKERAALEKETLKKLVNILARIDVLEAEIGDLQNE